MNKSLLMVALLALTAQSVALAQPQQHSRPQNSNLSQEDVSLIASDKGFLVVEKLRKQAGEAEKNGQHDEALKLYLEAMDKAGKLNLKNPLNRVNLQTLDNMVALFKAKAERKKNFAEVEQIAKARLPVIELLQGRNSPSYKVALQSLASCLQEQGKVEDAAKVDDMLDKLDGDNKD